MQLKDIERSTVKTYYNTVIHIFGTTKRPLFIAKEIVGLISFEEDIDDDLPLYRYEQIVVIKIDNLYYKTRMLTIYGVERMIERCLTRQSVGACKWLNQILFNLRRDAKKSKISGTETVEEIFTSRDNDYSTTNESVNETDDEMNDETDCELEIPRRSRSPSNSPRRSRSPSNSPRRSRSPTVNKINPIPLNMNDPITIEIFAPLQNPLDRQNPLDQQNPLDRQNPLDQQKSVGPNTFTKSLHEFSIFKQLENEAKRLDNTSKRLDLAIMKFRVANNLSMAAYQKSVGPNTFTKSLHEFSIFKQLENEAKRLDNTSKRLDLAIMKFRVANNLSMAAYQ